MSRTNIPKTSLKKLEQFFTKTLGKSFANIFSTRWDHTFFFCTDTNNDGLVNWTDFEAAIEVCLFMRINPIDKCD